MTQKLAFFVVSTISDNSKQVEQCKPSPEHVERYSQIVKELKERDTHVKKQDKEVGKRSLESGQPDDPVDVDRFDKMTRMCKDDPFKIVSSRWCLLHACM